MHEVEGAGLLEPFPVPGKYNEEGIGEIFQAPGAEASIWCWSDGDAGACRLIARNACEFASATISQCPREFYLMETRRPYQNCWKLAGAAKNFPRAEGKPACG